MKKTFFALLILTKICYAQPVAVQKIANEISTETLKKNLYYLASDKMEGRLMASHGDTLASMFIADYFKKNKLIAPYQKGRSYFQAITYYKIVSDDKLTINGQTYPKSDNWTSSKDFSSISNAAVLVPFFNDPDSLLSALSNAKGKAIVLPASLERKIGTEVNQERFRAKLLDLGIVAIISSSPLVERTIEIQKQRAFLPQYTDSITAFTKSAPTSASTLGLTQEKMNALLTADKLTVKDIEQNIASKSHHGLMELQTRISAEVKKSYQKTQAPNVIGIVKGTDPNADCIIISAHHDHDGRNGKEIYYGAVDNASGTVAIMEMAAAMNKAAQQGIRPKRNIVFASYTGEERGLLGSYYLADHPIYPLSKTRAVLNIDMMGRVDTMYSGRKADSTYAYFLVKDSLNVGLRNSLYKANEIVKLKLDGYYEQPQFAQRRIRGSDQYPFFKQGIPFVRIDCGFAKDYHKPTDTPDKINYPLLTKQVQLAFLTMWNMANE